MDMLSEYDGSGGAIGYSVFYYANLMYEKPNLKLLKVDGTAPSAESIGSGGYPLTNEFYAVIHKEAPADSPARLIRDWLLTGAGKDFMRAANYVPVG
jgi:phosphate transport system substrate-binding protein